MTAGARGAVEALWRGEDRWARILGTVLLPASWPYGRVVGWRNRGYDTGRLPTRRVKARVVSVGNLTVGGSGKTPVALWIAERMAASGSRVALVARGYRKRRRGVVVVSNGDGPVVTAADGGDEAVLLARRFRGPVVVGEDRVAAAEMACARFGVDAIVLDDGFQHRRLARDVDVVVVAEDPRALRLLPSGPLREEAGALDRATVVVVPEDAGGWARNVAPPHVTVVRAGVRATALVSVAGDRWTAADCGRLAGSTVAVMAGIARPQRFLETLERLGARVGPTRLLADHHAYGPDDLQWVAGAARLRPVVTTEKDLVKLEAFGVPPGVVALRIDVSIEPAVELLRLATGADVLCEEPRFEGR